MEGTCRGVCFAGGLAAWVWGGRPGALRWGSCPCPTFTEAQICPRCCAGSALAGSCGLPGVAAGQPLWVVWEAGPGSSDVI